MTRGDLQRTRDNQSELLRRHNRWLRVIFDARDRIYCCGDRWHVRTGQWGRTRGTGTRKLEFYNKSQTSNRPCNTPHINVWWDDILARLQAETARLITLRATSTPETPLVRKPAASVIGKTTKVGRIIRIAG